MKRAMLFAMTLLSFLSFGVSAQEAPAAKAGDDPGVKNPLAAKSVKASTGPGPGDLFFRTDKGEYLQINDDNWGVIVKNVSDATPFGRMQYDNKTYYIANSGKNAGYYLSYSGRGYTGTYAWTNAVAWTQDKSLCMTVDNGKSWKTYDYVTNNISYVVIGNYSYPEKCFLPVPATEPYQPIKLQTKYNGENASCTWQGAAQCPPYVVYYTESQSATLALSVVGGKLYQGNALFDTTKADKSHSFDHTSIFVMDMNGIVYASKQFKVFMFHHSSILAGRDVAFAGEMQVEQGVIKKISNCSGHYMPDIKFASQLKDSLNKQGYSGDVTVESCNPKFFDLNYGVLMPPTAH